ncbi:hypothetical protein BU16DRAFT_558748 [Lophium mytilinum]|uniref:CENP-V/GFA domain-containing protein n=1 Tax=Lophium mytilinum TaxID=390894 RepID=A0A6A6R2J5_9PEZI|nr:hypothetical protein BU16DRAFT_558748 [Lophium mytilinum]
MADTPAATPAASKTYKGSCHCGLVAFTATLSPPLDDPAQAAISCNCSICVRNAYLLAVCPSSSVEFSSGEDKMTEYKFGSGKFPHYFCPTCGTSLMCATGDMKAVNVRALEDVDLKSLTLKEMDGKSV